MEKKLPLGWESDELDSLIAFVIGGDWGKDPEKISEEDYSLVACIRGSEIKKWSSEKGQSASIRAIKTNSLEKRKLEEGDILLEISGGGPDQPVGRVVFIDKEVFTHNSEYPKVPTNFLRLIRPNKEIHSKYLFSYLEFFYYSGEVVNYQGGSNNLRNLKFKEYSKISIPLAPLPEQKRIAAKLDELFGHLDALKTKLDRIPVLLKNFRQQVLTQAVTGKLTEEWRKGKNLGEWEDQALADFSESRLGKMLDKAKNTGVPTEYLRNINVRWFHFDLMDLSKIKVEAEEINKYNLEPGDVLICEGGEPGRAAIWKNEKGGIIFQKALHRVRLKKHVLPDYLLYNLFLDAKSERLNELFTGTTIKHLTGRNLSKYTIQVPPLQEQQEIVKRVEGLFAVADKIEAQYNSLKTKIDTLPQAILNKAFKGELVPQNPNDEPASVLLERIKDAKPGNKKGAKAYKEPQGEIPIAAEPK